MGRTPKYSKEIKVKACKDYEKNNLSFADIAKDVGAARETVRGWYQKYKEHGPNALETSNKNCSYSKEFKQSVIEEYNTGNFSFFSLATKHNISKSVVMSWISKWYNGIENKDYDPKGDIYTMKSRKTTFKERVEIVKWVIDNDMSYKNAADKYSLNYALIYKWTRAYIAKGPEALEYQKRGPKSRTELDESSLTEVEKLKNQLEKEKALRKRSEFQLEVLKKKQEFENQI